MNLKVLALSRYGTLGASSRLRLLQYIYELENFGHQVEFDELFDDSALDVRYRQGNYPILLILKAFTRRFSALFRRKNFDLLWIEKEALPWFPFSVESACLDGVPYVLDYDDAVFHNYDQHRWTAVRYLFGRRLDKLMSRAKLVVCGNAYLAERAVNSGAPWVEILPTVIDLTRYTNLQVSNEKRRNSSIVLVWIGSPSTVRYLQLLQKPLQQLSQRFPFMLRIIGGECNMPGVKIENFPWAIETEVELINSADIGIMPLIDSPWEMGKCGYKLIQYMACGLPVVASPVGVNTDIVENGVNGYLATSGEEWVSSLELLITNVDLRQSMGGSGRAKVEMKYCIQKTGPKMAELLIKAAKGG